MVCITAEIGVNWDGNFKIAEQMMIEAKNANCDAVKFQAFNEEIVKNHPEKERLLKTAISNENIKQIDSISKKIGIEWYCTPMYYDAIDFLDPFVNRYKIRNMDSVVLHENKTSLLLDKVLDSKKEIIISSETNPKELELYKNKNIKWLYVVPKYPCNLEDVDFSDINDFNGYSNHCTNILAPLSAAILGAEMIEIHTTLDKKRDFVDNSVSFDHNELSKLADVSQVGIPSTHPSFISNNYLDAGKFVVMRTCQGLGDWGLISAMPRLLKQKYPNCEVYLPSSDLICSTNFSGIGSP